MNAKQFPPRSPGAAPGLDAYRRRRPSVAGLCLLCTISAATAVWLSQMLGCTADEATKPGADEATKSSADEGPKAAAVELPKHTASAYFRVALHKEALVFPTAEMQSERFNRDAFEIFRDTQAQLMTGGQVLRGALRKRVVFRGETTEVGKLPCVQRAAKRWGDPIVWLQDELKVGFPGDAQIMEVSLTATDAEEVAHVVNAVVDAYTKIVIDADRVQRQIRLRKLSDAYASKDQTVRRKKQVLRNVTATAGSHDPEALRLMEQMAIRQFGDAQARHSQAMVLLERTRGDLKGQKALLKSVDGVPISRIELEAYVEGRPDSRQLSQDLAGQLANLTETRNLINPNTTSRFAQEQADRVSMIQAQLEGLQAGAQEKIREQKRSEIEAGILQLEIQIGVMDEQEKRLKEAVKRQENEITELSRTTIDVEMARREVDRLESVLATIDDERGKLNVELNTEPRIQLIQRAEVPK